VSYLRATGGLTDLDAESREAVEVTPAELRTLSPTDRALIALKMSEQEVQRHQAFWTMLQGIVMGAIPLAFYLGFVRRRPIR
jgi:hypothetical protein